MMDARPEVGGTDLGPTPKPLLLASLAGCTGMDVVSLLKKMRVEYKSLNIKTSAEMTEEHPKHFSSIHVVYEFEADEKDLPKIEKAVNLSAEKYCGVQYMLGKSAKITNEIVLK